MKVTLLNAFHGTKARIRYAGGEYVIPESALKMLCPYEDCLCLGTPAGFPKVIFSDGVQVDLNTNGDVVLKPVE